MTLQQDLGVDRLVVDRGIAVLGLAVKVLTDLQGAGVDQGGLVGWQDWWWWHLLRRTKETSQHGSSPSN